jgi:hypothetical protein
VADLDSNELNNQGTASSGALWCHTFLLRWKLVDECLGEGASRCVAFGLEVRRGDLDSEIPLLVLTAVVRRFRRLFNPLKYVGRRGADSAEWADEPADNGVLSRQKPLGRTKTITVPR